MRSGPYSVYVANLGIFEEPLRDGRDDGFGSAFFQIRFIPSSPKRARGECVFSLSGGVAIINQSFQQEVVALRSRIQICQKSRRKGCMILHCKLQRGGHATYPILQLF